LGVYFTSGVNPHDELERLGIFDFSSIRPYFEHALGSIEGDDISIVEIAGRLAYLSAAEFSLLPILLEGGFPPVLPLRAPLRVDGGAASVAFLKTACLPYAGCKPGPHDMALFSSDFDKLRLAASYIGAPDEYDSYWDRFDELIRVLDDRYRGSNFELTRAAGGRGLIPLQGAVWKARLGTLIDHPNLADALADYARDFELVERAVAGA